MKDAKDIFQQLFVKLDEWYLEAIMKERFTWIIFYGVPMHTWNRKFFENLCVIRRSLISLDNDTEKKKRLDISKCLIRTTTMEIRNMVIKVNINESVFKIKMVKESFTFPVDTQVKYPKNNGINYVDSLDKDKDGGLSFMENPREKYEHEVEELESNYEAIMNGSVEGTLEKDMNNTLQSSTRIVEEIWDLIIWWA